MTTGAKIYCRYLLPTLHTRLTLYLEFADTLCRETLKQ